MGGCGVLLCVLLGTATPAAPLEQRNSPAEPDQPEQPQPSESQPPGSSPEQLAGVDPARLIPRLELRQRFTRAAGDARLHSSTLRMDLVLFRRALLRYELPLL